MDAEPNGQMEYGDLRLNRLREEHSRYSQQLESLMSKPYLSEEEKLEEVRLKKLKLHLKDQIVGLRASASSTVQVA
ncbi:MAG TPA: DUF465 domain-containing protein [Acidobacteriaceae bacterium]|jgi:hypothetical protein|nr:DUF465 domain-containing protein [Acidobacteriaceae bacterium]